MSNPSSESRSRLQPQVILLGVISLLNDSASEMIYPLLPVFLATTLGATPLIIGVIEGCADALASIVKLAAGAISDRLPRRKPLVVWGYGLAAASRALIAFATMWPAVLTARLIDRTGKGVRSAPRDALIADVTPPEQRGRAFGFHRALDHTGAVVGPLMALVLLRYVTMRTVFLIAVIPGAIGTVLLMLLLREAPRTRVASSEAPASRAPLPRAFWQALIAIALFSLANSSDAFLLLRAHDAGIATAMLPLLWGAHHVIKSLFSTAAGSLSDRVDRRYLLIAGWLSYAAIYAIFPFARTATLFFVLFVVYAIPFTLSEGAERAWIGDLVPSESRGRSFGIYYLANGLCVLAGTLLFGELYESVSPRAAFWAGAGVAVFAALAAIVAPRRATAVA